MYKKRNQMNTFFLCMLDCVLVVCSFLLAGLIRYGRLGPFIEYVSFPEVLTILVFITAAFFYALNDFERLIRSGPAAVLKRTLLVNLCIFASLTVYSFITKSEINLSRMTLALLAAVNTALQYTAHLLVKRLYNRGTRHDQSLAPHVLLFVEQSAAEQAVRRVVTASDWRSVLVGVVLIDADEAESCIGGVPVVATLRTYLEYTTAHVVDEALILPGALLERGEALRDLIVNLEMTGIVVNLEIQAIDTGLNDIKRVYQFGDFNVVAFTTRLFDVRLLLLKRLTDILGGLVGVAFTVLFTLFIAPAILLESPGPVFFSQQRVGRNGRTFRMYKFRSMYRDAEARKASLLAENEMDGLLFKMRDDPRITKIGKFLRKTSLDELPQFWNVLRGDMSLVGTRPPTLDEYKHYNHLQKRRLSFRPGLTGIWQISGRNDITSFDEVVRMDLEYIDSWSLALDSRILFKTVQVVLERRGAA